uniref:BAR domain-containing protein n=1 Tax=Panagrellus redivivus TaxID=6233 RepID=A0A7E4WBT1_PANRE
MDSESGSERLRHTSPTTGTTTGTQTKDSLQVSEKRKKKRSNLFLRVGEHFGVVEQTHLAPEFKNEIAHYDKYYQLADLLVDGIEIVFQHNPRMLQNNCIECPVKQDPHEDAARAARNIMHVYSKEAVSVKLLGIISDCFKQLAMMIRESQMRGRRSIRKLRRFVSKDQERYVEEKNKMDLALDIMDSARHDLKQTKTKDEVEEKGHYYEQCVHEFDVQAAKVDEFCQTLHSAKKMHYREVIEAFDLLGKCHRSLVVCLDQHLALALQLVPPEFVQKPSSNKAKQSMGSFLKKK